MKKLYFILSALFLVVLVPMKAQNLNGITIDPGWSWIPYFINSEPMEINYAFSSIDPEIGDVLKSRGGGFSVFTENGWSGNIEALESNQAYHYYSCKSVSVQYSYPECGMPVVATAEVSEITSSGAVCGGTVTSSGGRVITARGVCWSLNENPTTEDDHTTDGAGLGEFVSNVEGLQSGKTYYVRAYVTNSSVTAYGSVVSFTTEVVPFEQQYFTTESLEDGNAITCTISSNLTSTYLQSVSYSIDNGVNWTTWANDNNGTTISVSCNAGSKVMWKGIGSRWEKDNVDDSNFGATKTFKVYGNIHSLLYADDFVGTTVLNGNNSFAYLFQGTTALTDAGDLVMPASTATNYCYYGMFKDCTALTAAPALPATTLAEYCYYDMFYDCTSLTTAPALPATTLAGRCYYEMFKGCTSLTTAPSLPATTLANSCYVSMFYGCTSLTTAPALPATTLANNCYNMMFKSCTLLTVSPELPATTLTPSCYKQMFYRCTLLHTVTCFATDISATDCTNNWLYNVASSGTFYKDPGMTGWSTGASGIPIGWNVINYGSATVTTANITNITITTANSGGNVTSGGNSSVTARGVCWSTSQNPTLSDNYTTDGTGTGEFTSSLTDLSTNTTYYVRAYATNASGTAYGEQKSFTTIPQGAINGKYTINANNDQIYFSQGNLQYIRSASTPYWKFADNQWVVFGQNGQAHLNSNEDKDLFSWNSNGWHMGDEACQWRTMTLEEWGYVIGTRTTTSGIRYAKARVNGVNGVILLPDDWIAETYALSNTNSGEAAFNSNVVDSSTWLSVLEANGAVFLPAAGGQSGTGVYNVGSYGGYWSLTYGSGYGNGAYYLFFDASNLYMYSYAKYQGLAVRLVYDCE